VTMATETYRDPRCDKDGIEKLSDQFALGENYTDVTGYIIVGHVDEELAEQWGVEPDSYLMTTDAELGEISEENYERVSTDVLDAFADDHDDIDLSTVEPGTVRKLGEFKMVFSRRSDGGHYLVRYGYDAYDESELVEVDQ